MSPGQTPPSTPLYYYYYNGSTVAMLAARPRSQRVIAMLEYLLSREAAYAYELSQLAGVHSRHVYPLLKWWIRVGVVEVVKVSGYNLYRISSRVRRALEHILRIVLRSRETVTARIVERVVESRLYRRLKPAEREVVAMLAERLLTTSRYLRIRGESPQQALDELRAKIEERMRRRGASFEEISRVMMELSDALETLREEGVVYVYWDRRQKLLVLRLDKSVEEEVARILGR